MRRLFAIVCAVLIATGASADRPKIGLVLSGGGAKGAAHVGVLKVLEENGIPIDCIVGTSMGAIIGGLYAIGYTADELDSLMMTQDWNMVMTDKPDRRNMSFEKKKYDDRYIVKIPFGYQDRKMFGSSSRESRHFLNTIPLALYNGQNVYNLFTRLSVGYQSDLDFNKMPIPFACVAVDLINKEEVVFHNGNFVDAIRSSMAIPGYFAPVRIGSRVLIDGGVLNNYPVDVAKEMGADIIIGVKLGELEITEPQVDNIGDMFNNMLDLMKETKIAEAIANTDIFITPRIENYTALSFDPQSLRRLIENGESAARDKESQIRDLKRRIDEYERVHEMTFVGPEPVVERYNKAIHLDKDTIVVGNVIVNGLAMSDADYLLKRSCFKPGAVLTGKMIDEEISRFYNTDCFESVTYLLKGTEPPYDLELNFAGGRRSLIGVGFNFDTEEIASVLLNIGLNNNSMYGSRLSLTTKLSYNLQMNLEYSYAFKSVAQFNLGYDMRNSNLNIHNSTAQSNLFFGGQSVYAGLSTKRYRNARLDLGARMDFFDYRSMIFGNDFNYSYDLSRTNTKFLDAFAKLQIDTRDNYSFPTTGYSITADFDYYLRSFLDPEHSNFSAAGLHLSKVQSIGEHFALIASLDNRTLFGDDVPIVYMNLMGGTQRGRYMDQQIPFIGFNYSHIFDKMLSIATIDARARIMDDHYIFLSGSYALDCEDVTSIFNGHETFGARLGYAYDSVIGPLAFNINWSSYTKKAGLFLSMGYSF